MSRFEPHFEVLPPAQREVWPQLAPGVGSGLVLYGGTAIALRLGHRTSVDFDFFTNNPLDQQGLEQEFHFLSEATVIQSQQNTLSVVLPSADSTVKISFFGNIGSGRVGSPQRTSDGIVEVASLVDLLATNLKVILQRIEAKDYMDIAAILRSGASLEEGLAAATALYPASFQPSEALKALTYFRGGDLDRLPTTDKAILTRGVTAIRRIPVFGLAARRLSGDLGHDG